MKRVLAALLAAALWTSTAHARALVIIPQVANASNTDRATPIQEDYVTSILTNLGASFDVIRGAQVPAGAGTQNLRRGKWFNGRDTTTYDCLIIPNFWRGGYTFTGSWRPDSLTLTSMYPSVPVLFIGSHNEGSPFFTATGANPCSLGVGTTASYSGPEDSSLVTYVVGNPGIRFVQTNGGGHSAVLGTRSTRGWRPIWGVKTSAAVLGNGRNNVYDDSFDGTYPTDPDTVAFWEILNRGSDGTAIKAGTQAAAAPLLCLHPMQNYSTFGGDMAPYAAAFALLDSITGGALFASTSANPKLPIKLALHIDDGWKRGTGRMGGGAYGGIDVADTTTFLASLDSLANLRAYTSASTYSGVPYVVGVELDSLNVVGIAANQGGDKADGGTANNDVRWWRRLPTARFTPHCHEGTTTSTRTFGTNVGTPYVLMQDLWGTTRTRQVFTPGKSTDTSFYALHKRAFFLMDSTFGKGRVDHLAMPPGDDWSPSGNSYTSGLQMDSVVTFYALAGGTAIRTNPGTSTGSVSINHASNPLGYSPENRRWPIYRNLRPDLTTYNDANGVPIVFPDRRGEIVSIIACPGYQTTGDSLSYSRISVAQHSINGLNSMLLGRWNNQPQDATKANNTLSFGIKCAFLVIHCSDLQSKSNGDLTRPGLYQFKYPIMEANAVNILSLRPVIQWVYPEQLPPTP